MFKIPGHESFTTTIGKLNFFRWALESDILNYIEEHEEEIRSGYNAYLKETIQAQKSSKSDTASSTDSTSSTASDASVQSAASATSIASQLSQSSQSSQSSTRSTRRRRTKQSPSSLNKLQVYSTPIELNFN
jgi:hypothetical protein